MWPAAFWHEASTVHAVCPEHGERLDVSAPAEHAHDEDESGPRWTAGAEAEHHDTCPFVALAQPSSHAPEARDAGVHLSEERGACPAARCERRSSVPLLSLAPKHSPPVIA